MFVVRRQKSHRDENGMKEFIAKFGDQINGVLSGFDRLVFRGHLRGIAYVAGMKRYLWANQVLLKNFGEHADQVTGRLKEASLAAAKAQHRPAAGAVAMRIVSDRSSANVWRASPIGMREKPSARRRLLPKVYQAETTRLNSNVELNV
jgi:hypothetical protein